MTRKIKVGNVYIGGGAPISVQSMCNTKTADVENTIKQIISLQNAGCDIVRFAVNSATDAAAIKEIKIFRLSRIFNTIINLRYCPPKTASTK